MPQKNTVSNPTYTSIGQLRNLGFHTYVAVMRRHNASAREVSEKAKLGAEIFIPNDQ